MTVDDLPRLDPAEIPDVQTTAESGGPVVGVLLAGGLSSRFGDRNKLLADLDGEPLVRHAVRTLLDADLTEVVVVLGHEAASVRDAVADLDVRFVTNPAYDEGLSTSVARGVEAASDADAAVFLPGDMPRVDSETVDLLVDAYRAGVATALAAGYDGRRGNPVLFGRSHFDDLRAVEGDVGGRPVLFGADSNALVETTDPGVRRDVDTVDDLRRQR